MASVKFPRKEIEKHFKIDENSINKIMMMGIPVENVTEEEIEIEILANRPDLVSMHGFIKAVKAYLGKNISASEYKVRKPEKDYKVFIDQSVSSVRPYTACAIVKNLKFDDVKIKEIIDIQEKLHATFGRNRKKLAIGIYPLEKIKMPITYRAEKPTDIKFLPLESEREMNGLQILQSHPTGREYAHLLDGMSKFPVFIDSDNKVLSMPPIINSHETGKITENTGEVFIECSGFDLNSLKKVINIIVTTLSDMGGEIYSIELIYDKKIGKIVTPDLISEKMSINLDNVNKILGINIKEKDIDKLLKKMGYGYANGKVSIPSWRTDILHEVDIIEDIGIAYGYDNLTPEIPKVATIGEMNRKSNLGSKISEILSGLGYLEISSYYLVKEDEIKNYKSAEKISLQDSKTEYKFLRPNLIIPSIRTFSENKDNDYPQKIFEIGPVFKLDSGSETGIGEENRISLSLAPGNFTEVKRVLEYLGRMIQKEFMIVPAKIENMIDGRSAFLTCDDKEVGIIGEMHPEYLKNSNIKQPVSCFELNLDKIFKF